MCCSKGLIKRFAPFFLTFAVGLFIASFFVTVAAPNFRFNFQRKRQHQNYDRQRDLEIQKLREENTRLKNQVSNDDFDTADFQELKYMPMPPMPPMPPAPPAVKLNSIPRN